MVGIKFTSFEDNKIIHEFLYIVKKKGDRKLSPVGGRPDRLPTHSNSLSNKMEKVLTGCQVSHPKLIVVVGGGR